ncbi:phosphoenolpyruvate synthase [Conexibacter woesei]|uniref:phosphoenolpyruvate synthase n=1 Tax=Conexibacter woesei TaxID=191495 RepID=UPI0003F908B1|nr:phosphoenolpyruvate synthase [Conexibacter woesei]
MQESKMYVLGIGELDATQVALAGGKGASLGALARIEGLRVPDGFVVTTDAFAEGMTDDVAAAIGAALQDGASYAVRSSATGEDSEAASFAGQHDSFLNVAADDVVEHVQRVWASLSSQRAVAYRERGGVEHAAMAVVVQRMVDADASGILFTADPLTGNRKLAKVEAVRGLGDALVAGEVAPSDDVLSAEQVLQLETIGRRIEARFGRPQDIEWCLDGDGFAIVQARPITTLFPIPVAKDDDNHVYVSVGHQQMMTDAMKPLGLSVWQMVAMIGMHEAGGRLFVDVTPRLASPAMRAATLKALETSDPLIGAALRTVLARDGFVPTVPDAAPPAGGPPAPPEPIATDHAIVEELIAQSESSLAQLEHAIAPLSGSALLDFVASDIQDMKRAIFDPRVLQVILAAQEASEWLNEHLEAWLGERDAADVLTQSVPDNVTSEMGLALLDVADALRDRDDDLPAAIDAGALDAFLDRYGMRCVGEIDITRPRWNERPAALAPVLLSNIRNFAPGEGRRHFEQGLQDAQAKERDVLARLNPEQAAETKTMIDRLRTFSGYREYPKYAIVCRLWVYKRALLAEAERLVTAGVLEDASDMSYLTFAQLQDAVRTQSVDRDAIDRARAAFESYTSLRPPRVLTSDGEAVAGSYAARDGAPAGALLGLAVSAGTVEGRARVVLDLEHADFAPGDILVTTFTDPSWTPAFVAIDGLVTEVGGLMTHGAVIAREYGLPAVVGVQDATRLIRDGQRIRVDGTSGYVEVLDR